MKSPAPLLPDPRPVASAGEPARRRAAGWHHDALDAQRAVEYLDGIREPLPIYPHDGVAHPGWLLRRVNRILVANVTLGPWIHVGRRGAALARVHDGERVHTDARVVRVWERRGHKFVTLDVVITAGEPSAERVVMQAEHTAIYEPRSGEAD